ncbi:hypothetical protein BUUB107078_33825 [Burkholderia ubonensis]
MLHRRIRTRRLREPHHRQRQPDARQYPRMRSRFDDLADRTFRELLDANHLDRLAKRVATLRGRGTTVRQTGLCLLVEYQGPEPHLLVQRHAFDLERAQLIGKRVLQITQRNTPPRLRLEDHIEDGLVQIASRSRHLHHANGLAAAHAKRRPHGRPLLSALSQDVRWQPPQLLQQRRQHIGTHDRVASHAERTNGRAEFPDLAGGSRIDDEQVGPVIRIAERLAGTARHLVHRLQQRSMIQVQRSPERTFIDRFVEPIAINVHAGAQTARPADARQRHAREGGAAVDIAHVEMMVENGTQLRAAKPCCMRDGQRCGVLRIVQRGRLFKARFEGLPLRRIEQLLMCPPALGPSRLQLGLRHLLVEDRLRRLAILRHQQPRVVHAFAIAAVDPFDVPTRLPCFAIDTDLRFPLDMQLERLQGRTECGFTMPSLIGMYRIFSIVLRNEAEPALVDIRGNFLEDGNRIVQHDDQPLVLQ